MSNYPIVYVITEIVKGSHYIYIGCLKEDDIHKVENCVLLVPPSTKQLEEIPEAVKSFVIANSEALVFNETYIKEETIRVVRFIENRDQELIDYVEQEITKIASQAANQ